MLIGYARVSTDDQNLHLQRDALGGAGCERIFEDRRSGARTDRPGLAAALDVVRRGDTLVVCGTASALTLYRRPSDPTLADKSRAFSAACGE